MASPTRNQPLSPTRPRQGSVRVRRLTQSGSPPLTASPPALSSVSEAEKAPALPSAVPQDATQASTPPNTALSWPPASRPSAAPVVTGRRRAFTIAERLQDDFARENTPEAAASLGQNASVGNRRARAVSIVGSPPRRQSSEAEMEPSVVLATSPHSPRSRATSRAGQPPSMTAVDEHQQDEVDLLDVVDPQVATAAYLSNISSAIAVPALPFLNRAPVVEITSPMSNASLDGSTDELDAHAEHLVEHKSKKVQAKQILKGVWQFMKTPIGVFFTIYGILVVFWGAALVLILIHAIPMPSQNTRDYWVEICSQILTGLFTITGVGLIPWRARDTYRMAVIWTYANRVWRRRKHRGLAPLANANDLPQRAPQTDSDSVEKLPDGTTPVQHHATDASKKTEPATLEQLERGRKRDVDPVTLLTADEEERLLHQQVLFQQSQTWYRPHETATHYAFPLSWSLWICLLNDGNSIFQCCLCASMWGYATHYHDRPAWQTACGIVFSFLCGIGAGVLIWQGGKRTKKVTEVEAAIKAAAKERKERKKAEHHQHSLPRPHLALPLHHSSRKNSDKGQGGTL